MAELEVKNAAGRMSLKKRRSWLKPTIWMKIHLKTEAEEEEEVWKKEELRSILRSWGGNGLWLTFAWCGLAGQGACSIGS